MRTPDLIWIGAWPLADRVMTKIWLRVCAGLLEWNVLRSVLSRL